MARENKDGDPLNGGPKLVSWITVGVFSIGLCVVETSLVSYGLKMSPEVGYLVAFAPGIIVGALGVWSLVVSLRNLSDVHYDPHDSNEDWD
jgi:hypothetical protein